MIALALMLSLSAASAPAEPQADARSETEAQAIGQVLDGLHETAARADGPAYFARFTPDARFIGTDATERWSLEAFRAYAMPYFSQGQGWTYQASERVITVADIPCRCIAWFDEQLDNASYGRTRGSGVLRLTGDGWKIEQYVLSFAVPNERAREVVETIEKAD